MQNRLMLTLMSSLVILTASSRACAQAATFIPPTFPSTGITRFGAFDGGPDQVNLGNLNVHLAIPIRHKAGRKLDFSYDLAFDSSVWGVANQSSWSLASSRGFTGTNFAASGNNQMQPFASYSLLQGCNDANGASHSSPPGSFAGAYIYYSNFGYVDMAGVSHYVPGTITDYNCSPTHQYTYSGFGPTTDGSGISATIDANAYPQNGSTMPVVQFTVPGLYNTVFSNISTYGANEVDPNGNEISFAQTSPQYSQNDLANLTNTPLGTFTDTLGQTALTVGENNQSSGGNLNGGSLTYSFQNGMGTTSTFTMTYSQHQVVTNFACSGISEFSQSAILPDTLLMPDGRQYLFAYEPTPGQNNATTGRISNITFPGGGSVAYSYGPALCDGTVSSLTRTLNDGRGNSASWQYSRAYTNAWTTTVTDPQNNQKAITFWVGASGAYYEANRAEYSGAVTNGTLLRTVTTNSGTTEPVTQRSILTMLPNASGKTSQVTETYDYLGSMTQRNVFDFGSAGSGPGPLLMQQINAFDPVNNTFDSQVAQVTVSFNPQGPPLVVQQSSGVDGQAVIATSGIAQHTNTLPSSNRGNPTSVLANGRTTLYSYYDTGEVATATDADTGQSTTFSYGQCNGAYPTGASQTLQPSGVTLSTSTSWDCVGGVPIATSDANGKTASTTYADPLWRPTMVTDALGNTVTTTYPTSSSQTSTSSTVYTGGLPQSFSETTYDGLDRVILSQARQSPTASTYTSLAQQYDALGNSTLITIPYSANLGSYSTARPGTTTIYDALERPYSSRDAGGATLNYTYNLNDVLITAGPAASGETSKSRQLEYNGAGLLTSVCEITSMVGAGSCGQSTSATGYLTRYNYVGTYLTSVTQNAQGNSNSTQTRTVGYDSLGRKISETIPETGTSTYKYDTDQTCQSTSMGDLVKMVDNAGNVTCLAYDNLHRPLSSQVVSGPYASVTPQTHFVYDAATLSGTAMQNALGQLAEAYTCFGDCSSKNTDIFFSTSAELSGSQKTGRTISQVWEATPNSHGYFLNKRIVNANGSLAATSTSLNGASIGVPTVTYALDSVGRSSSVTDATNNRVLVSATNYDAVSGAVSRTTFGNGDSDGFTIDPLSTRPTGFQYTIGGSSPINIAGSLTWNLNGSLHNFLMTDSTDSSKNQNCGYQMDDLNRLASVNCAGSWAQNFSYDPFGNISKGPPSNPGAGQITQSYMAGYNSINNQANSGVTATYDSNGNQTTAEANSLAWNATAQAVTVNGVTATYDALGRMVETNANGSYTQFLYDPSGSKYAAVQAQQIVNASVSLPGGSSAVYNADGFTYFRHPDWLGSSRLATDWAHGVYSKEAYAPFGETYNEAGTPDRSFTGQSQGTAVGIFDYLFRKYDPVAGRWLSPDPAGWASVNEAYPQSLDRYAYVQNDPLRSIDPDGRDCLFLGQDISQQGGQKTDCAPNVVDSFVPDASYTGGAPGASLPSNSFIYSTADWTQQVQAPDGSLTTLSGNYYNGNGCSGPTSTLNNSSSGCGYQPFSKGSSQIPAWYFADQNVLYPAGVGARLGLGSFIQLGDVGINGRPTYAFRPPADSSIGPSTPFPDSPPLHPVAQVCSPKVVKTTLLGVTTVIVTVSCNTYDPF